MFLYIVLTVFCRHSFKTHKQHGMAWLLLFFYFFFWAKLSYSFLATFGRIVRDTRVSGDQPIEECYTLAFMSLATLFASFIIFYISAFGVRIFTATDDFMGWGLHFSKSDKINRGTQCAI